MRTIWFFITRTGILQSKKTATTLKDAWKKSIKKWTILSNPPKELRYINHIHTCGLCNLYLDQDCIECPIRKKTGNKYCHGPLDDYFEIRNLIPTSLHSEPAKDAAKAVLKYLQQLKNEQ